MGNRHRLLLTACVMTACAKEAPATPGQHLLLVPWAVPPDTQVRIDDRVVGTLAPNGQGKVTIPAGMLMTTATKRELVMHRTCGDLAIPFRFPDTYGPAREQGERSASSPVLTNIEVDTDRVPQSVTVYVDGEPGRLRVGDQALTKTPEEVFVAGCDAAGRTIYDGDEALGIVGDGDTRFVVVGKPGQCYLWRYLTYSAGGFLPNLDKDQVFRTRVFAGRALHYFLETPPEKISAFAGTTSEVRTWVSRVDCSAKHRRRKSRPSHREPRSR